MSLEIDLESKSRLDLNKVGTAVYAAHPSTGVHLACYAFDDEEPETWFAGEECPRRIAEHIRAGGAIRGWNVGFERLMWQRLPGWPQPRLEQFYDTMAQALVMGLPRSLEDAATALQLPVLKDMAGRRTMLRMSNVDYQPTFDDVRDLRDYCAQDVRVSRAVRKKLKPLSPDERSLWLLDQIINDRGVAIDRELVAAMRLTTDREMARLNGLLCEATNGAVERVTQAVALARWVAAHGVRCNGLAKDAYAGLLAQPMPANVRHALEIRREGSKSSTTKLKAATVAVNDDGRARGMLLYHGAATGRWSGRLLQPQNMVRGSGKTLPEVAIPILKTRDAALVEFCYDWPLETVSDCLRGVMVAGPGKTLLAGDYSNIEARITAWYARDRRKLDDFVRSDRGDGPGMYELAASVIYGVDVDDIDHDDPRRQTGKTAELALNFGSGVAGLAKMGVNYGIDFADVYHGIVERTEPDKRREVVEKCRETFRKGNGGDLSERAWIAAELVKQAWRKQNARTVESWKLVDDACWMAMQSPGKPVWAEGVSLGWVCDGGFLQLILPSGRRLYYGDPRVRDVEVPWSDKTVARAFRERKRAVTVLGTDSQTHQFVRYPLYPGLGIQHGTQAMARDLMAHGMQTAESHGFPIVLTVHDEVVAEVDERSADRLPGFLDCLCALPPYAAGLPLVASGWKGPRYHKQ